MATHFPPTPTYPLSLDTDYSLFLVYNTTETKLMSDNSPWAQEIEIVPVDSDKTEIWADNGYGNIEGELFYYDSVEKNSSGKVKKLKGCARQLRGDTKFNKKGTWIRSFVVAEHHNQLVDAIMKTQDFIGRNFDPRQETLDWRIRNLQELQVIFDDYSCPDINFTFNIIENDPVRGVLAEYLIEITPPGSISSYRLDFGDDEFTTTSLEGQHRYALNARIDPVVRASNDKCQIVQTPIERSNPAEPPADVTGGFDIPIPEVPDIPDFTFVPCEVPEPDINLPPLVIPCGVSLTGSNPVSNVIDISIVNMVSNITITPAGGFSIPSSIAVTSDIPSLIVVDSNLPPTIVIDPPIPATIVIVPPASNITMDLDIGDLPRLEVDWGLPPQMEVSVAFAKQVKTPQRFAVDPEMVAQFGEEFSDLFDMSNNIKVEYESVGIPSEITVVMPQDLSVKLDASELDQRRIKIDATEVNIPTNIKIFGPDSPIPNSIKLDGTDLPESFELSYSGGPIPIDASSVPKSIKIDAADLPNKILIEMPKPIPDKIVLEHNVPDKIILVSPTSIPISIPENVYLPVKFPDVMPQIEMVYKGDPIELKITMDNIISKDSEGRNCVVISPCPR